MKRNNNNILHSLTKIQREITTTYYTVSQKYKEK